MNVFRLFTTRIVSKEKTVATATTEERLIAAAQRGDRTAFDLLAQTYAPLLRGFVMRHVGISAVEDVLQETLIAGWTGLPGYTRRARFKAWLFAIALRKCADFHRARARGIIEAPLELAEFVADTRKDWYSAAEWKQTVRDLLTLLPEEQREVVELYYYAELTLPEIATGLERNLNTIKYQFYRGHALMEQELARESSAAEHDGGRKAGYPR